ncbi:MAG: hypothetical protein ACREKH_02420 [Candidatus Rokuibacteriota bacterium]
MAGSDQLTGRPLAVLLLATLSVALSAVACRESPAPSPPKAVVIDADPLDSARAAMGRHEYGAAAALLREVVVRRPADLEARYRLGVSASHLDAPDEARQAFEWVVAHGEPGAPEVRIAREWLSSGTTADPTPAPVSASPAPRDPEPVNAEMAIVAGRAAGAGGIKARLQLFLKGVPGTPVQDEYHVLRTDQGGNFQFTNVVPGEYMLTSAIAGPPEWRLRVSLGKGERLRLDLAPSNHASLRDDFPDPRP